MLAPKQLKELWGLQVHLAYIRRFISNLPSRCHPFHHLMKNSAQSNGTSDAKKPSVSSRSTYQITNFEGTNPREISCTLHYSSRKVFRGIMCLRKWGCQRKSPILLKLHFRWGWTKLPSDWNNVFGSHIHYLKIKALHASSYNVGDF